MDDDDDDDDDGHIRSYSPAITVFHRPKQPLVSNQFLTRMAEPSRWTAAQECNRPE